MTTMGVSSTINIMFLNRLYRGLRHKQKPQISLGLSHT